MVVYPLGPGCVLAAGSFGNEHRAWIAIVEFDGTKAKVEVIHEATKVWDHERNDNPTNTDPAMTFVPEAMFEHVIPGPKPRRIIFILGTYNPLLVDPETKRVWVYPVTDWYRQHFPRLDPPGDAFLSIEGILWIAGADRDFRSYRFDEEDRPAASRTRQIRLAHWRGTRRQLDPRRRLALLRWQQLAADQSPHRRGRTAGG